MITIICKQCNKEFKNYPSNKRVFCSKQCHIENQKTLTGILATQWKGGFARCTDCNILKSNYHLGRCKKCENKNRMKPRNSCLTCKKEFYAPPYYVKRGWGKFCSLICWGVYRKENELSRGSNNPAWRGGKPRCVGCTKRVANIYAERCRTCLDRYKIGEKTNNWKGGITKLYDRIRTCAKYYNWVRRTFERDDYTCEFCGKRNGTHNADHIKPFAVILHENNIKTFEQAINCKELWDINNGRTLCVDCHKTTPSYLNNKIIQQYANI